MTPGYDHQCVACNKCQQQLDNTRDVLPLPNANQQTVRRKRGRPSKADAVFCLKTWIDENRCGIYKLADPDSENPLAVSCSLDGPDRHTLCDLSS